MLTYVYDIPKFWNDSNLAAKTLGYVVNGWQMAGTAAFQSGAPYTVSDGFDQNADGTASHCPSINNTVAPFYTGGFTTPTGHVVDGPIRLNQGTRWR